MSGPIRDGFVAQSFSALRVGDEFWGALTVTESHVVAAAGAFNDPGPNHVNALQASRGRFGSRVAHGPLLVGIAFGVLGNALGATIVALLEQSSKFRRPTHLGDTVIPHWTVTRVTPKQSLGGGIVELSGEIRNGEAELLVELEASLAIAEEPPWTPWEQVGEAPRPQSTNRSETNR